MTLYNETRTWAIVTIAQVKTDFDIYEIGHIMRQGTRDAMIYDLNIWKEKDSAIDSKYRIVKIRYTPMLSDL